MPTLRKNRPHIGKGHHQLDPTGSGGVKNAAMMKMGRTTEIFQKRRTSVSLVKHLRVGHERLFSSGNLKTAPNATSTLVELRVYPSQGDIVD